MIRKQEVDLADYVRKALADKGLTMRDVEERSGGRITNSYVTKVVSRTTRNLSVDKLQALARGLGVSEEELFAVARGVKAPEGWNESRFFELYQAYDSLLEERHKEKVLRDIEDLLLIIDVFPKKADGHEIATVRRIGNHRS